MIQKKPIFKIKYLILNLLAFLLITQPLVLVSAQVTKTPKMPGSGTFMQPIEPLEMPEDYPQDLVDWFDQNMDARSYVVLDMETDKILAEREGNTPYPIASMSKVISVYLVYKAIADGKLTMDTLITIPEEIADNISANPNLSNVGLVAGEKYPVRDLIYGVMLVSGNDATSALLWEIYGNEELAVAAIKDQLAQWGITNIQFYQTSGAPNEELPEFMWIPGSTSTSENYMSAADVALMAKYVVTEFPEILEVTSADGYTFMEGTPYEYYLGNANQLLPGRQYGRENVTGLKSGYTDAAGKNFVATTTENGRKLVAVAMGVFGEEMSSYWEIEILLDALNKHPDLYKNENLPVVTRPTLEELAAQAAAEAESNGESGQAIDKIPVTNYENRRDNPLTNLMENIFGIFN